MAAVYLRLGQKSPKFGFYGTTGATRFSICSGEYCVLPPWRMAWPLQKLLVGLAHVVAANWNFGTQLKASEPEHP